MNVGWKFGPSILGLLAGCHEVGRYRASAVPPVALGDAMANATSHVAPQDAESDASAKPGPDASASNTIPAATQLDSAIEATSSRGLLDAATSATPATSTPTSAESTADSRALDESVPHDPCTTHAHSLASDCGAAIDCGWSRPTADGVSCIVGERFRQVGTREHDQGDYFTVANDGSVWLLGTTSGKFPGQPQHESDPFVRGWSKTGETLWTTQFVQDESLDSSGIAAAADGNLVVAMRGWNYLDTPSRVHLQAFTVAGAKAWSATITGDYEVELGTIAARPGGGVYVCVWEQTMTGYDDAGLRRGAFVVHHLDASGQPKWSSKLPEIEIEPLSVETDGQGIAVWPDGSLLVVGTVYTTLASFPFGGSAKLTKLDAEGKLVWQKLFQDGAEIATSAVIDPSGNIVFGTKAGRDGVVRKLTAAGEPVWEVTLGAMNEHHPSVATDVDGNIFAVMTTDASLSTEGYDGFTPHFGGTDVVATRLNAAGETLWTKQFGTELNDYALGITWSGGYAYAFGSTYGVFDGSADDDPADADGFVVQLVP